MLLLRGGRVVCPATGRDGTADVLVAEGRIAEVGPGLRADGAQVLDCSGMVVGPGLVDLGTELCDPGYTWREDLASGSRAGAAGGYTTLVASPATDPVVDSASVVGDVLARVNVLPGARVLQAGALTVGLRGAELAEVGLMVEAGAVALSDGGHAMDDALVLRHALQYAAPFGVPILLRPGEPVLERRGQMHEGAVSMAIGLRGVPAAAEEIGIGRAIALVRLTGAPVHLSHVTTARAVAMVRSAKEEGLPITAGVPARHLWLTDEAVRDSVYDTATRLLPPLRSAADRDALRVAVLDGTIDVVIADHVPWSLVEKEHEYDAAAIGAVGLETALSAALSALSGDLQAVLSALSTRPAALLGLEIGISAGRRADLFVFDPEQPWTVGRPRYSRGCNEPLAGQNLEGVVRATVVGGRLGYLASENPAA